MSDPEFKEEGLYTNPDNKYREANHGRVTDTEGELAETAGGTTQLDAMHIVEDATASDTLRTPESILTDIADLLKRFNKDLEYAGIDNYKTPDPSTQGKTYLCGSGYIAEKRAFKIHMPGYATLVSELANTVGEEEALLQTRTNKVIIPYNKPWKNVEFVLNDTSMFKEFYVLKEDKNLAA